MIKHIINLRKQYGEDSEYICGYEAGCLEYSLYHQLTNCEQNCVIIAPSTMPVETGKKCIKTDKRDAKLIATCLRNHTYKAVHIPTEEDDQIKEFIRLWDD